MREVPLAEIAKATRIATRYLEALENEDWNKLPGGVFGHGFVRNVAQYLGLNENDLLAEYDLARKKEEPPLPAPPVVESGIPRPPLWPFATAAGLVLVILVAGGIFAARRIAAHRSNQAPAPQPPAAEASVVSAAPPVTEPAPATGSSTRSSASSTRRTPALLDLSISISGPTRVRVTGDRYLLMDRHLRVGEVRHFTAKDHFEVTADDSDAVLLELNGQTMPAIGPPGASGTIVLSRKDLRLARGGNPQP